jgi:hypothetical protein
VTATPGQADDRVPFHWQGTWEEFDAEVRRRWIDSSERLGLDHGMPNAAAAIAAQEPHAAPLWPDGTPVRDADGEPQPAPGLAVVQEALAVAFGMLQMVTLGNDDVMVAQARKAVALVKDILNGDVAVPEPQPAPELAASMRETKAVLGLLDDFTHAVIDLDDGARLVGISRLAAAARGTRKKAGLPPVEGK